MYFIIILIITILWFLYLPTLYPALFLRITDRIGHYDAVGCFLFLAMILISGLLGGTLIELCKKEPANDVPAETPVEVKESPDSETSIPEPWYRDPIDDSRNL